MEKQKQRKYFSLLTVLILVLSLGLGGCDDGDDGRDGKDGADGLPGSSLVDASTASNDFLETLDVQSEITAVTIASPPVVNFSVTTDDGVPITGIGALKEEDERYVRFTIDKLVPGTLGDPDSWVAYVRDATSGEPDYETDGTLVDNGDGTYVYTFATDVAAVEGVTYEPALTHRVAAQIGSRGVALEAQNMVFDFVPDGSAVTRTRNIAVMESCNECHGDLVFHGRRFLVEYCVNCHNPDLAQGEGNMSFMIHRIHSAGSFDVLDDGIDYSEVTFPQDLSNCRKCHNGDDAATAQGDNWQNVPNIAACSGCHSDLDITDAGTDHAGGQQTDNSGCVGCHDADDIEEHHLTENATPNNPNLLEGQREIAYEIIEVTVDDATGVSTIDFRITSDGTALDLLSLPDDLTDGAGDAFRWPSFLLAWAQPQSGITAPGDYNNLGESAAQPISVGIDDLSPINDGSVDPILGTLSCAGGICTAVVDGAGATFPVGATLRAVGLQSYFRQDLDGDDVYDVSLHAPSAVLGATGDTERREVVDNDKCANCHEWFEGHGGNRVLNIAICTLCHVPNLSSSGRSIDPADAADRDPDEPGAQPSSATVDLGTSDTWTWPEDTNNLKDMIHGIHASDFRESDYEFVRGRNDGIYYNWSEVTFPGEVSACDTCHLEGTYELPLAEGLLETTVRTTGTADGLDGNDFTAVGTARDNVPNATDWVNTPTASTCYYCHDSALAVAHMEQNGGVISVADPDAADFTQRQDVDTVESCAICHGDGKSADLNLVHEIE